MLARRSLGYSVTLNSGCRRRESRFDRHETNNQLTLPYSAAAEKRDEGGLVCLPSRFKQVKLTLAADEFIPDRGPKGDLSNRILSNCTLIEDLSGGRLSCDPFFSRRRWTQAVIGVRRLAARNQRLSHGPPDYPKPRLSSQ